MQATNNAVLLDGYGVFGLIIVDLTKEFLSSRFFMTDMGEADLILVSTFMDTSEKLMPNNGQDVSQLEYSRMIGCLMYAMTCTRPDIAFDVVLEGYTDASWITPAGKEAEWLKNLLLEIQLWVKPIAPISICCDSAATLAKAYSQMYNGKSRQLGVRHSMIRELITNGVVSIEFVRSQQNLADHLTKGLTRDLVIKSAEGMRLNTCDYISSQGCAWNMVIKEDEVVNFSMVNFFEKVLSRSMNKEEPPMVQFTLGYGVRVSLLFSKWDSRLKDIHQSDGFSGKQRERQSERRECVFSALGKRDSKWRGKVETLESIQTRYLQEEALFQSGSGSVTLFEAPDSKKKENQEDLNE
ncbi:hypothetical protein Tco_1532567 [Tanacetum coccineum]